TQLKSSQRSSPERNLGRIIGEEESIPVQTSTISSGPQ
ncbi:MAG: hypothetical protein ACI9KK_003206, partial [Ascidiaceihabitans sp.]